MVATIIEAVSGIGIFLFGMYYLENALKKASGSQFRRMVGHMTSSPFKAILTGAASTAVLQSSSVVSLMALSFVGAGLLNLTCAIGVIFGSNLGTTFTTWIVAALGFKVKISVFALPMAGFGGLLLVFFSDRKTVSAIGRILVGFGLLFLGLDYMKTATEHLSGSFNLKEYADYGVLFFVLMGFIITAIIQSSSAATAIILSSLFAGIINFDMAAAAVIGTNVGTTVTALLGSIGGSPDKKRAALAHLIFNVITAIVALLLLAQLTALVLDVFELRDDKTIALALFHTLFNVLGIILMAPFISLLARYLGRLFVEKQERITKYIDEVSPDVPQAAFVAMRNETAHLFDNVLRYALSLFGVNPEIAFEERKKAWQVLAAKKNFDSDIKDLYIKIKKLEMRIRTFGSMLSTKELNAEEVERIESLHDAVREATYAAKLLKDSKKDLKLFAESGNDFVIERYETMMHRIVKLSKHLYLMLEGDNQRLMKASKIHSSIEEDYKLLQKQITTALIKYSLQEEDGISILNANKALYSASKKMLESCILLTRQTEPAPVEKEKKKKR